MYCRSFVFLDCISIFYRSSMNSLSCLRKNFSLQERRYMMQLTECWLECFLVIFFGWTIHLVFTPDNDDDNHVAYSNDHSRNNQQQQRKASYVYLKNYQSNLNSKLTRWNYCYFFCSVIKIRCRVFCNISTFQYSLISWPSFGSGRLNQHWLFPPFSTILLKCNIGVENKIAIPQARHTNILALLPTTTMIKMIFKNRLICIELLLSDIWRPSS